jgi:PAS domain S-box-containing protein
VASKKSDSKAAESALREHRASADLEAMIRLQHVGNLCSRSGSDFAQCLEAALGAAIGLTGADKGNIQLVDPRTGTLKIAAHRGFERPFLDFFADVSTESEAVCGAASRAAARVVVEDVTRSEMFAGRRALSVLLDANVRAVQSTPLVGSQGKLLGMISTHFATSRGVGDRELRLLDLLARQMADYLERKQAEDELRTAYDALRAKARELETLIDILPAGVLTADPACDRITGNRAFYKMLDIPLGGNASLPSVTSDVPRGTRVFRGGRELSPEEFPMQTTGRTGERVTDFDHDLVFPDGRRVTLLANTAPLLDEHGHVRGVLGAYLDITERQRSEEMVRDRSRQLEAVLDAAPLGVYVVDADFRIAMINPVARPVFGDFPGGLVGRDLDEILHLVCKKDYADELVRLFRRTLSTGESHEASELAEYRVDRDRPQYFEWRIDRFAMHDGRFGVVCYFRDISSHVEARLERELLLASERAARAEADRAARSKDEFLAILSHELRTPLNAIAGWTHLLKQGAADPRKVLESADVIERNTRIQTQLIADLLDMSRITSGKMRLDVARVDLPAVVAATVESMRPAAEAKRLRFETAIGPVEGEVLGDAARIGQILTNVLSNALKFTPKGGAIETRLRQFRSHVEIVVTDTGEGIEPEFLPHLFDRFSQGDASTSRKHGGLGLGLALVKQLTELHGGTVEARSEGRGKGATFVVRLPLVAAGRTAVAASRTEGGLDPSERFDLDGLSVLVVDDDPDSVEMVRRVLEAANARVVAALDADEAVVRLRARRVDVIVCDIGLPGRDGYELLRDVRSRGVLAPAIALTAFARSEDRSKALEAGYQAHVSKPMRPSELLGTVAFLGGRRSGTAGSTRRAR